MIRPSLVLILLLAAMPEARAVASEQPKHAPWLAAAGFVAGGLTGFVAHEGGHLLANALLSNRPRLVPLWAFGFVPFFAISPDVSCRGRVCLRADGTPLPGGRMGKFVIVTAGFEVQHLVNEVILTQTPSLRHVHAPWRKGWLAFNILLSCAYALTSVVGIEDPHGDAGGAAHLARLPRAVMGAWLTLPALLDAYRYHVGEVGPAAWASRAAKGGFVSLALTF